jgi:hypothetical protein
VYPRLEDGGETEELGLPLKSGGELKALKNGGCGMEGEPICIGIYCLPLALLPFRSSRALLDRLSFVRLALVPELEGGGLSEAKRKVVGEGVRCGRPVLGEDEADGERERERTSWMRMLTAAFGEDPVSLLPLCSFSQMCLRC